MVRLMLIEDDRQLNNALKIYFENAGYLVFSVRDTAERRDDGRNVFDFSCPKK